MAFNTIIRADGLPPNTPRVACPAGRQFPANLRGWPTFCLSGRDTGTYPEFRNKLEVFRENRPAMEEIARRKYLSGRVEPDGTVLIHTVDIPH